jgi:catechol-2,3-dioxygenase
MIKGLFAVTIKSSDPKKLAKFYTDVVGLKVRKSASDIVMLELGDDRALVIQDDEHIKPVSDAQSQVRGSLAFEVSDVAAARKQLEKHKVKLDDSKAKKSGAGLQAVTAYDPDGNRVDFVARG